MPGDSAATKRRLLDAAAEEFATFGVAGARVDRIALAAEANKAQIYHYFTSKEGLFEAVFDELVVRTVQDVPIDASDLPGYAARLFDRYESQPTLARLAIWYRLERGGLEPIGSVAKANEEKVAKIAAAQEAGIVPTHSAPWDLLLLVTTLAAVWATPSPEFTVAAIHRPSAERRLVVVQAVAALVGQA